MTLVHLVRVGSFGMVGQFVADQRRSYARGCHVLCRTDRGLEVGEVLARVEKDDEPSELDGELVRQLAQQDELRLIQHARQRDRAVEICQTLLDRNRAAAVLVDAVYPFDGQSMFFYILGDLGDALDSTIRELQSQLRVTVTFQSIVEERGSDCGSGGCGSGGCGSGGCGSGGCGSGGCG